MSANLATENCWSSCSCLNPFFRWISEWATVWSHHYKHWENNQYAQTSPRHALKRKRRHFDEFFTISCTGSCQNDNFQCCQWWKFRQNDDKIYNFQCSPWWKFPQNDDISVSVWRWLQMTWRQIGAQDATWIILHNIDQYIVTAIK